VTVLEGFVLVIEDFFFLGTALGVLRLVFKIEGGGVVEEEVLTGPFVFGVFYSCKKVS